MFPGPDTRPSKQHLSFDEMELAVLDELCDDFKKGDRSQFYERTLTEHHGVDEDRAGALYARLESLGLIHKELNPIRTPFAGKYLHNLDGSICQVAARRRAEIEATTDRVSAFETMVRSHPVAAKIIIIAFVFVFVVTAANQTLELIDKFTDDAPPAADADEAN